MKNYRVAVIPGDGIGIEVIEAGLAVLDAAAKAVPGFALEITRFDWGSDYYRRHGRMMPADGVETLRGFDAIYFGAVGDPEIADHVTLWGLRLAICQGLDQYANVRPASIVAGVASPLRDVFPGDLDLVILRENSEGEYAGAGGRVHRGLGTEVGIETAVFTRTGVARIMRFAFDFAEKRPRRRLTLVTKSNAQGHGMVLWDTVYAEIAESFPTVETERLLVDAAAARMVADPHSFDVVVATNLHADILSDLAAALAGGLGLAPSANLDPERRNPSMFEPVHGSAFDIAGTGIANPIGAIRSAAMMLDHLGAWNAARAIENAVDRVLAEDRVRTPDIGGTATTPEVTAAICRALAEG